MDIDTEAGYARYALTEPKEIDFVDIEEAAKDAGYTLKEVVLEIEGVISESQCEDCEGTVLTLRVPQTGQTLELEGDVPIGAKLRLRAAVRGWGGVHTRLVVLPASDSE